MTLIHNIFYYATFFIKMAYCEVKRLAFGIEYIAEVDVTDDCNLRCKHCYHFNGKHEFNAKETSAAEWEERFVELHKKGIRSILLVGGEPTLRQDVILLADKIFPVASMITNGTIKVPHSFNHPLIVSLDGAGETNDNIRGAGVFSKVLANYSGDGRVIINMTLHEQNYTELEKVVRIAIDNGFRGVICNIYTPTIEEESGFTISKQSRKVITTELKRVKDKYPKHILLSKGMMKWFTYPDHKGTCFWGDNVLHFDASWNTRRCFARTDCSLCGCLSGSIQNPVTLLKSPSILLKLI